MTPQQHALAARRERKRLRDAARARVRAEAAVRRAEEAARAAEELAPLAQRVSVHDASGALLRAPRLAVVDGRAIRTQPLGLSRPQRLAAARFASDWDEAQTISAGVARLEGGPHGVSGSAAPDAAVVRLIAVRARLEGAMAWVGAFLPALLLCVCGRAPVAEWARESGQDKTEALAWVRAGINRLVMYYDNGERPKPVKMEIVSFGPERGEYET